MSQLITESSEAKTLTHLVPREQLCEAQICDMYELLDSHFEGVSPAQFRRPRRKELHHPH